MLHLNSYTSPFFAQINFFHRLILQLFYNFFANGHKWWSWFWCEKILIILYSPNFCDEDFHKLHTMMKISVKKIPCKQPWHFKSWTMMNYENQPKIMKIFDHGNSELYSIVIVATSLITHSPMVRIGTSKLVLFSLV